jgi:hypothetical protein
VQGKKSWNVFLEDVEDGAAEKYTQVLKSKEWNVMQTMTMGEGGMTQAIKNNVMIMAIYNGKDKAASISVSTQIEQ